MTEEVEAVDSYVVSVVGEDFSSCRGSVARYQRMDQLQVAVVAASVHPSTLGG
jgi:hypothetical protein